MRTFRQCVNRVQNSINITVRIDMSGSVESSVLACVRQDREEQHSVGSCLRHDMKSALFIRNLPKIILCGSRVSVRYMELLPDIPRESLQLPQNLK